MTEPEQPDPTHDVPLSPEVLLPPEVVHQALRQIMRERGSARTERKRAASAQNGRRHTPKPLSELECTCGAGDSLTGHKALCPRGRAIKRRASGERA